jgi:parallel beta-helix repeat protein
MNNVTLTSDLDCSSSGGHGLVFGKGGLTINLNGHALIGPAGDDTYYGVYTDGRKNVTVKNGTLANWGYGLYSYYTVGGTYKNLTINGDSQAYEEGVFIYYGADNLVNNVTINDVGYGIDVEYSGGNWVTNNTVNDGYESFYVSEENGSHFSGNHANGYSNYGFYEYESSRNVWTNNHANAMGQGGSIGFYMECDEYGWVTLLNNTSTGNSSYGFEVYECWDYYAGYGGIHGSLISGNTANDNTGGGFYDYYSLQATYTNNTAKRNAWDGFYMDYPGGMTFKGNVANRNDGSGIYFDDTDDYGGFYGRPKTVKNNTAKRNDDYGIYSDAGIGGATGNVARYNGNAPDNCYNISCN